jgi:hypothetical protein
MIAKTLILSLVLVAGYSIFLARRDQNLPVSNHQWQDNSIKAENFLYKKHRFERVIVGSSLSSRLLMDSLPNYYNLCFAGMGVFEGLKILTAEKVLPDVLFIEMNTIFNKEDKGFTSAILNPVCATVKKFVPALRDGSQPLSHFTPLVTRFLTRAENKIKTPFPERNGTVMDAGEKLQIGLQSTLESHRVFPEQEALDASFAKLNSYVNFLAARNVKVVFFELPMHPSVTRLPFFKVLRQSFLSKYPSLSFLPNSDCGLYQTTDGLHLNGDDAARYTQFFKDESRKY